MSTVRGTGRQRAGSMGGRGGGLETCGVVCAADVQQHAVAEDAVQHALPSVMKMGMSAH